MIEVIYEPIHIENIITAIATVLTAVIAFLIMGVNNFYSNKRLKIELKHLAEESEKERESRIQEDNLKNQLVSLEQVFSTLQKMRSLCYQLRLKMFGVILKKVSIEDALTSINEILYQLMLDDESIQILAHIYLVNTPARTDEIIEYLSIFSDLSYRSRCLLNDGNIDEAIVIFTEEMKPQIVNFREYLDDLESQLCQYIIDVKEQV